MQRAFLETEFSQLKTNRMNYQLSIIHYPLSIIHYPLSIIHYPLSIIHYPLSIIHCPSSHQLGQFSPAFHVPVELCLNPVQFVAEALDGFEIGTGSGKF